MAISSKGPSFADAQLVSIRSKGRDKLDLYELIEDFRQRLRLLQLHHPVNGETHSAFSTNSNTNTKVSFRGQQTPPKPCICSDTHWVADCYYLAPEKRPTGWSPNSLKQKVDDALQNSRTKTWVDTVIQKQKEWEGAKPVPSIQQPNSISGGCQHRVSPSCHIDKSQSGFILSIFPNHHITLWHDSMEKRDIVMPSQGSRRGVCQP